MGTCRATSRSSAWRIWRVVPVIFSTTLAPPIVGASLKALDLLSETTELRDRLMDNTRLFREGMTARGFDITPGEHPIVPIVLGDAALAGAIAGTAGDLDTERTARLACALGAVNTLRAGACLFDVEAAGRLYAEAEISIIGRV